MGSESQPPKKQSPQRSNSAEKLNQALPPLPTPDNCCLMPSESLQMYHARMERFRRICEVRTILRWTAEGQFDLIGYMAGVTRNRGKESACALKDDLVKLFYAVIKRDPSLCDLLCPQLKRLIQYLLEEAGCSDN